MNKISKNIRRLRTAGGMTQEQLASVLNVTRQTVSSWETDRTHPDIDLLAAIAEALGADIEELIYGKKRTEDGAEEKRRSKKTITVVFSVLGSLLVAVGVILLFAELWADIPEAVKGAFAFLPLAAGAAAAIFAFHKKPNSAVWREGACVLWIAGTAATNAMVNSMFSADLGFVNLLMIDTLLVAPMMFIMDSTVPLLASAVFSSVCLAADEKGVVSLILSAAVTAAVIIFIVRDRTRRSFTEWIGFFTVGAMLVILPLHLGFEARAALLILSAVFLAGFAADSSGLVSVPLRFLCLPGAAVFDIVISIIINSENSRYAMPAVTAILICAFSVFLGARQAKKDKLKLIFICIASVITVIGAFAKEDDAITTALLVLCAVNGAVTAAKGFKASRLLTVNLGIANVICVLYLFLIILEPEPVQIGIALTLTGAALLLINRWLIKRFRLREGTADENCSLESGVNTDA